MTPKSSRCSSPSSAWAISPAGPRRSLFRNFRPDLRTLFALLLLCVSASARDWTRYPAVQELDNAPRIFAVGDAHSDFVRLTAALRAAGVIDRDNKWIAGSAVLVSTGDMIDKGPRALDVLRLYRTLRETAPASGGRAIVLAGNHEAEFMANPAAPKGKDFIAQLQAAGMKPAEIAACKGEIGDFLCSLPFAARVNDVFFSHAGNSAGRTLAQLRADIQKDFDLHGFAAPQLIGDGSVIEARLNGTGPGREPWIDAGLAAGLSEQQLLTDYTKKLGVTRIVEGHVPSEVHFTDGVVRSPGEMFQRFGLLYLIDTGMSELTDESEGAVLRLDPHASTAICPDGRQTQLWPAPAGFGRAAPCRSAK